MLGYFIGRYCSAGRKSGRRNRKNVASIRDLTLKIVCCCLLLVGLFVN